MPSKQDNAVDFEMDGGNLTYSQSLCDIIHLDSLAKILLQTFCYEKRLQIPWKTKILRIIGLLNFTIKLMIR